MLLLIYDSAGVDWCYELSIGWLFPSLHYLRVSVLKIPTATGNNNLQASNLHAENGKLP